ncbi:hypothetical protein MKEN_01271400 [Mycena kentingensis (nom. inval.)]|nr:hypothetical protein MKEN_01271400 [Mycena kentingensis (nom. inval.)]
MSSPEILPLHSQREAAIVAPIPGATPIAASTTPHHVNIEKHSISKFFPYPQLPIPATSYSYTPRQWLYLVWVLVVFVFVVGLDLAPMTILPVLPFDPKAAWWKAGMILSHCSSRLFALRVEPCCFGLLVIVSLWLICTNETSPEAEIWAMFLLADLAVYNCIHQLLGPELRRRITAEPAQNASHESKI